MGQKKSGPARPMHPVVAQLREIRLGRRQQQTEAAAEMGVSQGMLSSYESGATSPQLWFLELWTEYFGFRIVLDPIDQVGDLVVEAESDERPVMLSRYQIALAMGMLIAASRDEDLSPQMGEDLRAVADMLARAL